MGEIKRGGADFVGYEYKDVVVSETKYSMYLDGYENFGWQENEKFQLGKSTGSVTLHLRRDRKIANKTELTRLQRNFEANMEEITTLERSKTAKPQIASLTVGILGTVFMAGSTFAVTAVQPMIWLCILLAIPGFIGWVIPYFLFQALVKRREVTVAPLLEQKYDEIYILCQKGNELL